MGSGETSKGHFIPQHVDSPCRSVLHKSLCFPVSSHFAVSHFAVSYFAVSRFLGVGLRLGLGVRIRMGLGLGLWVGIAV